VRPRVCFALTSSGDTLPISAAPVIGPPVRGPWDRQGNFRRQWQPLRHGRRRWGHRSGHGVGGRSRAIVPCPELPCPGINAAGTAAVVQGSQRRRCYSPTLSGQFGKATGTRTVDLDMSKTIQGTDENGNIHFRISVLTGWTAGTLVPPLVPGAAVGTMKREGGPGVRSDPDLSSGTTSRCDSATSEPW
jgi:hypothetical protein